MQGRRDRWDVGIGLGLAGLVGALALHFTVRDDIVWLAYPYYAARTSLIVLAAVTVGGVALWRRRPRWFGVALLVALLAGSAWWARRPVFPECGLSTAGLDVVLWNVQKGERSWDGIVEQLRATDADVIALVEGDRYELAFWHRELPGYEVALPGGQLVLLSRHPIVERTLAEYAQRTRTASIVVETPFGPWRFVMVDIAVGLLMDRPAVIEEMQPMMLASSLPTVVLGDFNTPADSLGFDTMREHFRNSLTLGDDGGPATWPTPLPLLSIDHVWTTPDLHASCPTLSRGLASDHARIQLRLSPIAAAIADRSR